MLKCKLFGEVLVYFEPLLYCIKMSLDLWKEIEIGLIISEMSVSLDIC
jgi:hypothetical protein